MRFPDQASKDGGNVMNPGIPGQATYCNCFYYYVQNYNQWWINICKYASGIIFESSLNLNNSDTPGSHDIIVFLTYSAND